MKALNIFMTGCGLAATLLFMPSCKKDLDPTIKEENNLVNTSQVQLYNAIVGSNRNYVYVDTKPLNGATIAYGSSFPSNAYGFSVPSGFRAFLLKDTLVTSTQLQLSFAENLQSQKNYTIFAYDTITAPKQLTVETKLEIPTDTTARVRFANFLYSTTALPAVDVYSVKRQANVFSGVIKTGVTDFIPYASALNDTLLVRWTGTTTQVVALNGFNPTQKRSYTVIVRGGATRAISTFANR